ncbi:TLC domain containing protein [Nitzschia inconspicua]|uniref:TLC domain containing protein n=1 Tax=Nitzschia inconspicua TaxID=303405 RepID=A0A9K3PLA9_9STRA|nr:TLC domain containing protein [Nitzschia inconspicua]
MVTTRVIAKDSEGTVVPPSIHSNFARRRIPISVGLLGLTLLYNSLLYFLQDSTTWLRPADDFCKDVTEDGKCNRSDLFAFQAASGVMQLYMGLLGMWTWHFSKAIRSVPNTSEGRLFGYLKEADYLNTGIFIYQTFDFFASIFVPEHCTAIFLTHHVLAAYTAWMSLEFQMVHYYAIFFGGCSEISTIFLVLCDFDVYFPAERGSVWGAIITFCQVSFTFAFLYYRVIGWWYVSVQLWSDVLTVAKKKAIDNYRPGKAWFLYCFLLMDLLLGLLQVYWFGFGIVPKILEILQDGER